MTKSRRHKIIVRTILILIGIYFLIDIFGGYVVETIIKNRLESYINDTPDRLYDISYRTIEISIADRAVRLGKIKVEPRQNAIDSIMQNKLSTLTYFETDTFYFEGFSFVKLILFNKLKLEEIFSRNPIVKIYINPKAKIPPKESGVTANTINTKLKKGYIKYFKIENGNFYIYKVPSKDSLYFKLNSSNLIVDKIDISPDARETIDKVRFRTFHFSASKMFGDFIEHYSIKTDSIKLEQNTKTLNIRNLSFKPKDFVMTNKKVQFAHDIPSVDVGNILIKGISFKGNGKFDGYYASKINIDKLNFSLSTDKRLPKNMNRKPLIGELIKKVPLPFAVDTVNIKNSSIFYNEIVSAEKDPLKVLFTDVNLTVLNATNTDEMQKINPDLTIKGDAMFLDAGKLDLTVNVPLTAKEDKMIVSAHLGPTPLAPVNKMLEGPLGVRFISGNINSVDLNFIADTKHSEGKLLFDYSDLSIQIFKSKESAKKGLKEKNKWFINAVANGIIKKTNDRNSDKFVTGIIDYERPQDIGIQGYLFRSIKSGLISTFKPGTRRKAVKEEKKEVKTEKKQEKSVEKPAKRKKQNSKKKNK